MRGIHTNVLMSMYFILVNLRGEASYRRSWIVGIAVRQVAALSAKVGGPCWEVRREVERGIVKRCRGMLVQVANVGCDLMPGWGSF